MFFEKLSEISQIAAKCGCAVFVVPKEVKVEIKGALVLEPVDKSEITVDQVREIISLLNVKQKIERFILIRQADKLNERAANALLKSLEEPKDNYHFALITENPSSLLPTILSRAALYILRTPVDLTVKADKKVQELAKKFIVARPQDLPGLAEEIAKKKDNTRGYAIDVVGLAIEMLYKSYFKTGNVKFIQKNPKFLKTYENLVKNGHIKLHLVADLL